MNTIDTHHHVQIALIGFLAVLGFSQMSVQASDGNKAAVGDSNDAPSTPQRKTRSSDKAPGTGSMYTPDGMRRSTRIRNKNKEA